MSYYKNILFLSALLFSVPPVHSDARTFKGWEKISENEEVSVYKIDSKNEGLLAFGGEGVIDEPFLKVVSVVMDVERLTEWMSDVEESKVVRWTGPLSYIEYDHVGTPFIIKDREFLTEVKMTVSGDKKSILFENFDVEDPAFPKDKYVRGKLSGSNFEVQSIEGGKRTRYHAEIHCDPMGSMPRWVVNLFQKSWPTETLKNLKKQLKKADLKTHPKVIEYFGKAS